MSTNCSPAPEPPPATAARLASTPLPYPFELRWQGDTLTFTTPRRTTRGVLHSRTRYSIICENEQGELYRGEACPIAGLSPEYTDRKHYEALLSRACQEVTALQALPPDYLSEQSSIRCGVEGALLRAQAAFQNPTEHASPIWESAFTRGEAPLAIHHLIWMDSLEQMEAEAATGASQHFPCLKLKIGTHDWTREHALLTRLRARYPCLEIRVDANGALPLREASARLHELAELGISWIEQPLPPTQREQLRVLIASSPAPLRIALDESLIGLHHAEQRAELLDELQPHGLVLKPSLHGGLSGCEQLLHAARERGIRCWTNSMLESELGLTLLAEWSAAWLPDELHGLSKGKLYCQQASPAEFPSCQLRGNGLIYARRFFSL